MKKDPEHTQDREEPDRQAITSDMPSNVSGPGEDLSQIAHDEKLIRLRIRKIDTGQKNSNEARPQDKADSPS